MKTNQEPLYWVTTKNGKHIPVFDKDPKKNAEILKARAKAYKAKHTIETGVHVEPFTRMATYLAKQGISNEDEIENYLKGLSATRRSKLAREMGLESRGSDKIKEMAHKIYLAGKKDIPTPNPEPVKKEEPKKPEPAKPEVKKPTVKQATHPDFPQEYESILGKKHDVDPIEQLTKCNKENAINPHFNTGNNREYNKNCALCTCAIALQARGYDVEAMPRDKRWRGPYTIFQYDYTNPDNFIIGSAKNSWDNFEVTREMRRQFNSNRLREGEYQKMPRGAKQAAEAIINKSKEWGSGSVAELSVDWKGTSTAHSVAVINQNGFVFIFDAQTNTILPEGMFARYLTRTIASHTELVRLDNTPLKIGIEKELEKMVKIRDTSVKAQLDKGLAGIDWDKF